MHKNTIGIWLLAGCLIAACTSKKPDTNARLQLVATTGMVADMAKNIGGDSVDVTALLGAGVDPHLYKATQGDLSRLQKADMIVYNGLHLEGKMAEVFEKLEKMKTVVAVADQADQTQLLYDPSFPEAKDPHIWFDVQLWASAIDGLCAEMVKKDPDNKMYFTQNAAAYKARLLALHEQVQAELNQIPREQRVLITAHDAFNYFGRAYNMDVRGLQGISTLSEFGLKDRVDLVNFIVDKKIKAVFVETSVSTRNINSIVEGCQSKGHALRVGGNLFSDAMGAPDTPEGTYEGMVRANVKTIVSALK